VIKFWLADKGIDSFTFINILFRNCIDQAGKGYTFIQKLHKLKEDEIIAFEDKTDKVL
jgi:uncharacterized membrane protein YgaE (UPF0421/DUF939 family)